MRNLIRRHALAVSLLAALAGGTAVFVAVWFQPQKLFLDETVTESAPAGTTIASGVFRDRAHHASGAVRLLTLPGGERVLRIEGLDVENGPDLYVYLTEAKADAPNDAFGERFVSLGKLKGNKGDQTYAVPAGVDVARYASAAIWCKRFSVVFGTAALA